MRSIKSLEGKSRAKHSIYRDIDIGQYLKYIAISISISIIVTALLVFYFNYIIHLHI